MATIPGYAYIGCYPDGPVRLLDRAYHSDSNLTIQACGLYCNGFGLEGFATDEFYPLIGVEDGQECFCGSNYTHALGSENTNACNMACFGDPSETCGGDGWIDIYSATVLPSGITLLSMSTATSTALSTATPVSSSISTITEGPTSTPSPSPLPPHQTSATVIAVSVIAGILALALLTIFGLWFLRGRKRRSIPEMSHLGSQHQNEPRSPPSDVQISELVSTEAPRLQLYQYN
jgi:hypothetical protein